MLPIEAGNGRILRPGGRFGRDCCGKFSSSVETCELAPPEKVEMILVAVVVVQAQHVHIGVTG